MMFLKTSGLRVKRAHSSSYSLCLINVMHFTLCHCSIMLVYMRLTHPSHSTLNLPFLKFTVLLSCFTVFFLLPSHSTATSSPVACWYIPGNWQNLVGLALILSNLFWIDLFYYVSNTAGCAINLVGDRLTFFSQPFFVYFVNAHEQQYDKDFIISTAHASVVSEYAKVILFNFTKLSVIIGLKVESLVS